MIEAVRIVAAALTHAGTGVNAQLPGIPRDAGDPEPPAVARVLDATKADRLMADGDRSDGANRWPALVVLEDEAALFDGEVGTRTRDGVTAVTVAYLARDPQADGVAAASGYTRRAVVRAVRELLRNASAPERTRNGVYLIAAVPDTGVRYRPPTEPISAAATALRGRPLPHAGAVTFTFELRDTTP